MAVLKRRSRTVSVRLSEQEYQKLLSCCVNRGARSISDLTREAMQVLLAKSDGDGKGDGDGLENEMEKLHGRMRELDHEVKRLASLVAKAAAGAEGTL
jgi:hypothetical protein